MSVRRVALDALLDVTDKGAYANLRLKEARRSLGNQRDAAFVTALVYGVLDHLLYLDFVLSHFIKGGQKPVIRGILRMGACEILCMRSPLHVACNENVALVKEVGKGALSGYVNGVLRAIARAGEENALPPLPAEPLSRHLSLAYSWPEWLVQDWLLRYGPEFTQALLRYEDTTAMCLRAQYPFTGTQLQAYLTAKGVPHTKGRLEPDCFRLSAGLDIGSDPLFQAGKFTVQGESAMLACRAAGIKPGMRVLDACAAPGGKTACLWSLSKGQADITAWELHPHRKALLDKTLSRLHAAAKTEIWDAAQYRPECAGAFDLVVLDVPCSGFGVSGDKPDLRYAKTPEGIAALANTQGNILRACSEYVRPGGALLYVSCTISPRENQEQITAFLAEQPDFVFNSLAPYLPNTLMGLETGMLQLFPHRDGTEGFFIARMERKEG